MRPHLSGARVDGVVFYEPPSGLAADSHEKIDSPWFGYPVARSSAAQQVNDAACMFAPYADTCISASELQGFADDAGNEEGDRISAMVRVFNLQSRR